MGKIGKKTYFIWGLRVNTVIMRLKNYINYKKSTALALLVVFATLLTSVKSYALGLGEIQVFSALNQPLEAEITLNNVRPGEMEDLILQLASEDAFNRAGVERIYLLTKLEFKSVVKSDGTNVISVSSKDIIREPFLNFLVNVEWPRGKLVREYTILLDPPAFFSAFINCRRSYCATALHRHYRKHY